MKEKMVSLNRVSTLAFAAARRDVRLIFIIGLVLGFVCTMLTKEPSLSESWMYTAAEYIDEPLLWFCSGGIISLLLTNYITKRDLEL